MCSGQAGWAGSSARASWTCCRIRGAWLAPASAPASSSRETAGPEQRLGLTGYVAERRVEAGRPLEQSPFGLIFLRRGRILVAAQQEPRVDEPAARHGHAACCLHLGSPRARMTDVGARGKGAGPAFLPLAIGISK
jgi:hypothetical protein